MQVVEPETQGESRVDGGGTHKSIVLAMVEVEGAGEGSALRGGGCWGEARDEAGDLSGVGVEGEEVGAEEVLLTLDGGDVDGGEEGGEEDEDDPTGGRGGETEHDEEGAEVQGVSGVGVGAGGGELCVLAHIAGGVGAEPDAWDDEEEAEKEGKAGRVGEAEIEGGDEEAHGDADAPGDALVAGSLRGIRHGREFGEGFERPGGRARG